MLTVTKVSKGFARGPVLRDINFDLNSGEVVSLIGASGVGKSTLLEIVAGAQPADTGEVVFENGRTVGYCLQDARLLPWRTVAENVSLPLELKGLTRSAALTAARELLRTLHIDDWGNLEPASLSGGMVQKVAIAQVVATGADCLILDEPFASMDWRSWQAFGGVVRRSSSNGCGILFTTHILESAVMFADRVIVLRGRPAVVGAYYSVRNGALWSERGDEVATDLRSAVAVLMESVSVEEHAAQAALTDPLRPKVVLDPNR